MPESEKDPELAKLVEKSKKEMGVDLILDVTEEDANWLRQKPRRRPPA